MTLKTSLNKINPAINMYFQTLKRNGGLIILFIIIGLLLCPGFILANLPYDYKYIIDFNDYLFGIIGTATIISSLLAVLMNTINFSYMYSKKSSDVFHALPLTRCELLFSRFAAGYTSIVIPLIPVYISAALLTLMPRMQSDIIILLWGFLFNLAIVLLCSAISLVFIVCAGTVHDMVISLASYTFGTMAIAGIINTAADELLIGFWNNSRDIFCLLSPVFYCGYGLSDFFDTAPEVNLQTVLFFITIIIGSAVLLLLSAFLYRRRRAETAGDSYSFRFIYVICSFIIAFLGAYLIGAMFYYEFTSPVFWIFAVIGALITAVIFGLISNRSFKRIKESLITGAVSFSALAAVAIILCNGGFGFSTRVPNINKIDDISLSINYSDYNDVPTELALALHNQITADIKQVGFTTVDAWRKKIPELHGAAIASRYTNIETFENELVSVDIIYHLKNGREMNRSYYVPAYAYEKALVDIYTDDSVIKEMKSVFSTATENILLGTLQGPEGYDVDSQYDTVIITHSEAERLLNAYSRDIKKATAKSIAQADCEQYYIEWAIPHISTEDSYTEYESINLTVEEHFEETRAVLKEIDIPSRYSEEALDEYYIVYK